MRVVLLARRSFPACPYDRARRSTFMAFPVGCPRLAPPATARAGRNPRRPNNIPINLNGYIEFKQPGHSAWLFLCLILRLNYFTLT